MYVSPSQECSLAWSLAELVSPHLSREDRAQAFARIGAGEVHSAMLGLLEGCQRAGVRVPLEMLMWLRAWVNGYAGTDVEVRFRPHVDRIASGGHLSSA